VIEKETLPSKNPKLTCVLCEKEISKKNFERHMRNYSFEPVKIALNYTFEGYELAYNNNGGDTQFFLLYEESVYIF